MTFGVWSTYQHYCVPNSRPHIVGESLDDVVAAHSLVPRDGRYGAIIAEAVAGEWRAVCLVDSSGVRTKDRMDPRRYDEGRRSGYSLKANERAVDTTPPSFTRWVGQVY